MPPLSHHEILRHVGPFTQASRQVDLGRSDRAARVLEFKPVLHSISIGGVESLEVTEHLQLDLSRTTARLRRTLSIASGLQGTLTARGTDLSALLERVIAVPVERHFRIVATALIVDSYRCPDDAQQALVLRESKCRVLGLEAVMDARTVIAEPLTITLTPLTPLTSGAHTLPDDIVATLGHAWSVLRTKDHHSEFVVRVPGREAKRTRAALKRFERTVQHLVTVLGSPPAKFHPAYRRARWFAWCRRLIPLAVIVAMLACLPLLSRYGLKGEAGISALALGLPNLLMLAFLYFSRHEMPTIGIPPIPRPLRPDAWPTATPDSLSIPAPNPDRQPENHAHG